MAKVQPILPNGVIPNEAANDLSYTTYSNADIYPHCVTLSMPYEHNYDYEDLRINAPDGEWQVAEFTFHWEEDKRRDRWFTSTTLVKVKDGVLDVPTLVKAAAEVREQHRYHGMFLEKVEFVPSFEGSGKGYLSIVWGS